MPAAMSQGLEFPHSSIVHETHPHPDDPTGRQPWCATRSRWKPTRSPHPVTCLKCLRLKATAQQEQGLLTGPHAQCPQCGDFHPTLAEGLLGGHRQGTAARPWCSGADQVPLRFAVDTVAWRCTLAHGRDPMAQAVPVTAQREFLLEQDALLHLHALLRARDPLAGPSGATDGRWYGTAERGRWVRARSGSVWTPLTDGRVRHVGVLVAAGRVDWPTGDVSPQPPAPEDRLPGRPPRHDSAVRPGGAVPRRDDHP